MRLGICREQGICQKDMFMKGEMDIGRNNGKI